MNGRCYAMLRDFERSVDEKARPFMLARIILLARFRPSDITPEVDDPALEERLRKAIDTIASTTKRPARG